MKSIQTEIEEAASRLDRKVSNRVVRRFGRTLPEVLIRRALRQAREVAVESGWPLLAFPVLAEEMVERVRAVAVPGEFGLAEVA